MRGLQDELCKYARERSHQQPCSKAGFKQQPLGHELVLRLWLVLGQRPQLRMELSVPRRPPPLDALPALHISIQWTTILRDSPCSLCQVTRESCGDLSLGGLLDAGLACMRFMLRRSRARRKSRRRSRSVRRSL